MFCFVDSFDLSDQANDDNIIRKKKQTSGLERVVENYFFLFLNQNIGCGCSKEPSQ